MTDLADRYGTRTSTGRKGLVAVIVILAGVGLSWLAWVMLVHGRPLVESELNGFETVDAHTTIAEFTVVRRDDRVRASCLIRAFAADHTIVGERVLPEGPRGPATQTLERAVRTEREATSVEVVGCVTDGQSQRR